MTATLQRSRTERVERPRTRTQTRAASGRPATTPRRQPRTAPAVERGPRVAVRPRREAKPQTRSPFWASLTRLAGGLIVCLLVLAVFVIGVFPTGSYYEQRSERQAAEADLGALLEENRSLERRIVHLESDDEIAREAREYGMVFPDEESYLVLPTGN